jgi:cellulose synthase/poly-beta-1,6-N-acetylglucosamine synthase-like glycosyltransferase
MPVIVVLIGALAFLSIYSYFVYPLVLLAARHGPFGFGIGRGRGKRIPGIKRANGSSRPEGQAWPRVSLIITAHNEEDRIRAKIENSLGLEYPAGLLEIIVASDGSTDRTDAMVAGFPEVKLVRVTDRKGKEHAQKHGIKESSGEVLVFTDVATMLDRSSVKLLARHFENPDIGALSSTDRMIGEDGKPSGEGLYVRYEMLLRRLESDVRGLVGLSGSFFAARRSVCMSWAENLPSDFNTVLNCARLGYRAVSDDAVIGYYKDIKYIKGAQSEFQRKVRTLVRGITAFFANLELLDFRRFGFFSFQLVSHKLMRWLAPVFLILLILVTGVGMVAGDRTAYAFAIAQALFYGLALVGFVSVAAQDNAMVKVPFFFTQVNVAILTAWVRYLRGDRITMWAPSKR